MGEFISTVVKAGVSLSAMGSGVYDMIYSPINCKHMPLLTSAPKKSQSYAFNNKYKVIRNKEEENLFDMRVRVCAAGGAVTPDFPFPTCESQLGSNGKAPGPESVPTPLEVPCWPGRAVSGRTRCGVGCCP